MLAKHGAGGEWEYTFVVEAKKYVGLHPIRLYIKRGQTKISERVAFRPVYELCTEAEQIPGMSRMVLWWDQDAVNEMEE